MLSFQLIKGLDSFQSPSSKSNCIIMKHQSRIRLPGTGDIPLMPRQKQKQVAFIPCRLKSSGASLKCHQLNDSSAQCNGLLSVPIIKIRVDCVDNDLESREAPCSLCFFSGLAGK